MRISHRLGRGLLRGSVGLLTMAGVLAGPVLAAHAATPPGGGTVVRHTCEVVVDDGHFQGVVCADLVTAPDAVNDGTDAWGQNEVYCQAENNSADIVACSGIHETPVTGTFITTLSPGEQICGTQFGHSACGALKNFHTAPVTSSCPAWGESVRTSIVLKDSGDTGSVNVLATTHDSYAC
jgi:hypothetical protein